MTKIFLCDLEFRHYSSRFHSTKEWTEWFSRLKINWSILHLNYNIIHELTIER